MFRAFLQLLRIIVVSFLQCLATPRHTFSKGLKQLSLFNLGFSCYSANASEIYDEKVTSLVKSTDTSYSTSGNWIELVSEVKIISS